MQEPVISTIDNHVLWITLNRPEQHNALNEALLIQLQTILDQAVINPQLRLIILKSNGQNFSAGADLSSMHCMIQASLDENRANAMLLGRVLYTLHHAPVPTLAMVQGSAIGGGAGLVAACDLAIAANTASFGFSEVTLGLVPAMVSPYVVRAIGERASAGLFLSAERIDAQRALTLQLIHHCVEPTELLAYTQKYAARQMRCAPQAVRATKVLLKQLRTCQINQELLEDTVDLIAQTRVSSEGQHGLKAFLTKTTPAWNL